VRKVSVILILDPAIYNILPLKSPLQGQNCILPNHSASPLIFGDGYNFELRSGGQRVRMS